MNKLAKIIDLPKLLWVLICLQLCLSLYMTGRFVLFGSSLDLWLSRDYFDFQKAQIICGPTSTLSAHFSSLPSDASILLVTDSAPWFINYYLLPRKLYYYPEVTTEGALNKLPPGFIKDKKISSVLIQDNASLRLLNADEVLKTR